MESPLKKRMEEHVNADRANKLLVEARKLTILADSHAAKNKRTPIFARKDPVPDTLTASLVPPESPESIRLHES